MARRQKQRRCKPGFAVVFQRLLRRVADMSLNRCEQRLFDYLHAHKEERQHWQTKLHAVLKISVDEHVAAVRLEGELWRYYVERSDVVPVFRDAARHEGVQRTSMRNLADLMMRLWLEPRLEAKPKASNEEK